MGSGEVLVELTDGSDGRQAIERVFAGMRGSLPAHARFEAANEIPLVDEVLPPLERADAFGELNDGGDRTHALQRGRRRTAVVSGELEREVAAKRVAGDHYPIDPFTSDFCDDVGGVGGEAGMVQPVAQGFGAAAVPLIEQEHVESACVRLRRNSPHVVGGARAFETMQHQQRRMRGRFVLPVAMGEHAGAWCGVEVTFGRRRQRGERPRLSPAVHRHDVAVPETSLGDVVAHRNRYTRSGPLEYATGKSSASMVTRKSSAYRPPRDLARAGVIVSKSRSSSRRSRVRMATSRSYMPIAASLIPSTNTSRSPATRRLVPYCTAWPGCASQPLSCGVLRAHDITRPQSLSGTLISAIGRSGNLTNLMYALRVNDASAMTRQTIRARRGDGVSPSPINQIKYAIARKSSIQKTRGTCNWMTSATRAALSGSASRNTPSSARHPPTSPASPGIATPAAARRL